jgi:hypothetical protein
MNRKRSLEDRAWILAAEILFYPVKQPNTDVEHQTVLPVGE